MVARENLFMAVSSFVLLVNGTKLNPNARSYNFFRQTKNWLDKRKISRLTFKNCRYCLISFDIPSQTSPNLFR